MMCLHWKTPRQRHKPVKTELCRIVRICYRPQRSCGKVMFLHLCHSVHRGKGVSGRHPRWADPPPPHRQTSPRQTPLAVPDSHPLGRQPRQTPPGRHPLGSHPPGRHPPPADTPPAAATAADGTHPTGMHSCSYCSETETDANFHCTHFIPCLCQSR